MSHILAGRLDDLPSDIRHHLGAFRHKVFVQRLHWEIPGVSIPTRDSYCCIPTSAEDRRLLFRRCLVKTALKFLAELQHRPGVLAPCPPAPHSH